jgi:hypothetical protein
LVPKTPFTTPVALTVAQPVLLDDQVPPGITSDKVMLPKRQSDVEPVIAGTVGTVLIVTMAVAVLVPHAPVTV